MKLCETCKHWDTSSEDDLDLGRCRNIPQFWDATRWSKNGEDVVRAPKYKGAKAFVKDGSDYFAVLLTAKDFGCVSHAPKGVK